MSCAASATNMQPHSGVSGFMDMLGLGNRMGSGLRGAGKQASELAEFLRQPQLGLKAYVLHTRYNSIVTVGEFDQLNGEEMQRLQRQIFAFIPAGHTGVQSAGGIRFHQQAAICMRFSISGSGAPERPQATRP